MSAADCVVCSIKTSCRSADLYLYAPTEILSERIGSVLTGAGIPFSHQHQNFALAGGTTGPEVIDLLRAQLSEPEAHDLRITSDLVNLMGATSLNQFAKRVDTEWFEDALVHDRFTHWFQPIVNAREEELVGHECLIRLARSEKPGMPWWNGQEIIDAAVARGDLHVFDSYSRRTAIRSAAKHHKTGRVFINFTPSSIYDPAFCMASTLRAMEHTHLKPSDVVFEVVESEQVSNPKHLRHIADYYREKGFGVALDDVGTGSNSLQMVGSIRPDFIKLDKSIVWNCHTAIGATTVRKLAELGAESGIAVIAEGVEDAKMRDALLENGISLMQGYFFGKPSPSMRDSFPV